MKWSGIIQFVCFI